VLSAFRMRILLCLAYTTTECLHVLYCLGILWGG